jgi:hypothetical protein
MGIHYTTYEVFMPKIKPEIDLSNGQFTELVR